MNDYDEDAGARDIAKAFAKHGSPETTSTRKIDYLDWLWLQHSQGEDSPYYKLAHLVLDGGPPPTSPWKNKTTLNPLYVHLDIQAMYATRRYGITQEHLDQAKKAITAYAESTETVTELVEARRFSEKIYNDSSAEADRVISEAIREPFEEAGLTPTSNAAFAPNAQLTRVYCAHTDEDTGRTCRRKALQGDAFCSMHGGQNLSPQELKAIYASARAKLLAATEAAVDTTIELATSSPNDEVRRKAAEMIMDRTGLIPGVQINVSGNNDHEERSATEILLERLARLNEPDTEHTTEVAREIESSPDYPETVIHEAEIVEETP